MNSSLQGQRTSCVQANCVFWPKALPSPNSYWLSMFVMKWSQKVNSGLWGYICLRDQALKAEFMEAEGCGSISEKKKKKQTWICKQVKDFLRCEGEGKGDWEGVERKIRGRKISRDSSLVKRIYLKKIRGREAWERERLIHLKGQPERPFPPHLADRDVLEIFLHSHPCSPFGVILGHRNLGSLQHNTRDWLRNKSESVIRI